MSEIGSARSFRPTLSATLPHAIEAAAWAGAYFALGALPDNKSAMLRIMP
jgi:hypothetical protein